MSPELRADIEAMLAERDAARGPAFVPGPPPQPRFASELLAGLVLLDFPDAFIPIVSTAASVPSALLGADFALAVAFADVPDVQLAVQPGEKWWLRWLLFASGTVGIANVISSRPVAPVGTIGIYTTPGAGGSPDKASTLAGASSASWGNGDLSATPAFVVQECVLTTITTAGTVRIQANCGGVTKRILAGSMLEARRFA